MGPVWPSAGHPTKGIAPRWICAIAPQGRTIATVTLTKIKRIVIFTCARYPQKSQMMSAHLKFVGSRRREDKRLHLGQAALRATSASPDWPWTWFFGGHS